MSSTLLALAVQDVVARPGPSSLARALLATLPAATARTYEQAYRAFSVSTGNEAEHFPIVLGEWLVQTEPVRNKIAQRFVDAMNGARIEPATIHTRLAALRRLLSYAKFVGAAAGDLTLDQIPAVETSAETKAIAPSEILALERELESHPLEVRRLRDTAMLRLLYPTGLRIGGEDTGGRRTGLLGLNVDDYTGDSVLVGLKGRRRPMEIPVSASAREAIDLWIRARRFALVSTTALFVGIDRHGILSNERLLQQTVRKLFSRLGKDRGLKRVNPHAFRHAVGTQMVRTLGMNLADVRDQLGHANISTTQRYVSFLGTRSGEAQERLEAVLRESTAAPHT